MAVDLELRPGIASGLGARRGVLGGQRHGSTLLRLDGIVRVCLVLRLSFAPWEWDNMKLMFWSWIVIAPYLWTKVVAPMKPPARVAVCMVLFFSGGVSLLGGLDARHGYANRPSLRTGCLAACRCRHSCQRSLCMCSGLQSSADSSRPQRWPAAMRATSGATGSTTDAI